MPPPLRRRRTMADVPNIPAGELPGVLKALRDKFGQKTIVAGTNVPICYRIPTGIYLYDYATLGGIPHSRVTMFHGAKHSGKSTGSLRAIMGAQQTLLDQKAVLVDVEGTYDQVWAGKIGVDNDNLLLVQPDTGEQAVDIAVALVHTREVSLVVVDSLAALLPIKEEEASASDSLVGQQSRMITSMLRKVSAAQISERKRDHHVTVLYTNQERSKIGGWSPSGGEVISLPGGKALGHFTSVETKFKNKENLKKVGDTQVLTTNDHAFSIGKNKLNAGMRQGDFVMMRADDDDLGLTEGELRDGPYMLSHAKARGWYTGGGRAGYTLEFGDYAPQHFANAAEAEKFLYGDRDYMWSLRCNLIAEHAEESGMPPWYVTYIRTGVIEHV